MEFIRKISAYLMTALMLVATTNIVLSAHICSSELYNFSLFEETTACCQSNSGSERDPAQTGSLALSDGDYCCSSKTLEARGVDIVYPSIGIREIDYQSTVLQLEIFDIISLPSSDVQSSVNSDPYLPHFADRDIPVLVQSFLL
jgi:hypothetical protein